MHILKYPLQVTSFEQVIMSSLAWTPLTVQMQKGIPVLWAEVDDHKPQTTKHRIRMFGTGWSLPENIMNYLGTVQDSEGYVWHYYEMYPIVAEGD